MVCRRCQFSEDCVHRLGVEGCEGHSVCPFSHDDNQGVALNHLCPSLIFQPSHPEMQRPMWRYLYSYPDITSILKNKTMDYLAGIGMQSLALFLKRFWSTSQIMTAVEVSDAAPIVDHEDVLNSAYPRNRCAPEKRMKRALRQSRSRDRPYLQRTSTIRLALPFASSRVEWKVCIRERQFSEYMSRFSITTNAA